MTAVPDRRRRPSDGLVVEASILARLLGIRILKLDATVVIAPADVRAPRDSRRRTAARARTAAPARPPVAVGGGLAEAVRRIDEGAAILAQARRNGRAPRMASGHSLIRRETHDTG